MIAKKVQPALIDCVTYPTKIRALDGERQHVDLLVYALAAAIAHDVEPGDDATPTHWLRDSAIACVNTRVMHRLIKEARGETLVLTKANVRRVLRNDPAPDIGRLVEHAARDIGFEIVDVGFDDAALVVVLAVLIYESETSPTQRKAHTVLARVRARR